MLVTVTKHVVKVVLVYVKMRRCVVVTFLWNLLFCLQGSAYNEVWVQFSGSNCTIERLATNSTPSANLIKKIPLPHLDCFGRNITRIIMQDVARDVRSITLSHNNLIQLHIDDFESFSNLSRIEIKSNSLKRIIASSKNLLLPSVTYLSLKHNQLAVVPANALKSFPNLEKLILSNNLINTITDDDFRFNPKLKSLRLGQNQIKTLGEQSLLKANLTELDMNQCGLSEIPKQLANHSTLTMLDLSNNQISTILKDSFSGATNLKWITLASNRINVIESNAFKGANSLSKIDLSDNLIQTLPLGPFDGAKLENLQINLYENPINCNCSLAWFKAWVETLQENDISTEIRYKCIQPARNHGKKSYQIKLEDFTCESDDVEWTEECKETTTTSPPPSSPNTTNPNICPSLCTCYDEHANQYFPPLDGPQFKKDTTWSHWKGVAYPHVDCIAAGYTDIPVDDIREDISMISMAENNISVVDLKKLKKFSKLQILDLKKNAIDVINPDNCAIFENMRSLDLRFNNLTSITKDHLQSFPNLKYLALHHNKISDFPNDIFTHNGKLNYLYLGPNPIKNFKDDFLENLDPRTVYFRNMSLTRVPMLLKKWDNLLTADLSDNSITTINNSTFSNCKNLLSLSLENNNVSKIEANAFNGAVRLATINLSANKITTLPSTVFANVTQEQLTVSLWANPLNCDCKLKDFKLWVDHLKATDFTSNIRFLCHQPLKLHNKFSDQTSPDAYTCSDHEILYNINDASAAQSSNPAGMIATTVFITILLTVVACFVIYHCYYRIKGRRGGGRRRAF